MKKFRTQPWISPIFRILPWFFACCRLNDSLHKQGLKDNTNIEPVNVYKQGRSRNNCYNVSDVLALKEALQIERESIRRLQEELDEERNAAASAADEAMAMIARLQKNGWRTGAA